MTGSAFAAPLVRRHARLGRYALWQSRDFGWNIAIVTLLLFGTIGYLMHMQIETQAAIAAMRKFTMPATAELNVFSEVLSMFATVAPIIAVSGIVSTDRTSGYTRFLFAKPVSPVRFYAQSLVIRFIGYLAVGSVLLLVWSRFHPPGFSWKFLVDLTCCFVSVGGVVFLASVLTRFDGLVAIIYLLLSAVFWGKWYDIETWKHYLVWPTSPAYKLGEMHSWFLGLNAVGSLADLPFPAKWFEWNVGYGLACVLLGLVMLRRVPLTKA